MKEGLVVNINLFCITSAVYQQGETKLICWSTGANDPTLSKNQKNNITKFWPTGFFLIYHFLLFEKKEIKHNKLI